MFLNICFFVHPRINKNLLSYYHYIKMYGFHYFIRSSPSFFELTYMLLQNKCMYNVTNSFKWKKEKNMQTSLYGKIKEKREVESEWLIGANTQNISYLLIVATQHKTRQRHLRRLLMRVKARINDGKAQGRSLADS